VGTHKGVPNSWLFPLKATPPIRLTERMPLSYVIDTMQDLSWMAVDLNLAAGGYEEAPYSRATLSEHTESSIRCSLLDIKHLSCANGQMCLCVGANWSTTPSCPLS
jgi:hypothetical protein